MMRLSENIRTVSNHDGGVVLDLRQGKMFRLNITGATILGCVARGWTEQRIAAEISNRCGIDGALAFSDVLAFLASLKKYGLLLEGD